MQGIEVVTFDCPEWEIGVSVGTLQVWGGERVVSRVNIHDDDDDGSGGGGRGGTCALVRRCLEVLVGDRRVRLQFHAAVGVTEWVHLAEVRFYGSRHNLDCGSHEGEGTTTTMSAAVSEEEEEEDTGTTVASSLGNLSEDRGALN